MAAAICKLVLIVINLLFLLIGLALAAGGAILAFFPDIIMNSAYKEVKNSVANLGAGAQFTIPPSATELEEIPLAYEIGLALLCLGIALFIIAFCGCCGSCCSCCRLMLILFALSLLVLMIVEIAFFTLFFLESSPLHEEIKNKVAPKIELKGAGDESKPSSFDQMMNLINYNFECCGINGVEDYSGYTPMSCSKGTTGCYQKLQDLVQDNLLYAALVAAALLLLQLIEMIFAIIIYKDAAKISPI